MDGLGFLLFSALLGLLHRDRVVNRKVIIEMCDGLQISLLLSLQLAEDCGALSAITAPQNLHRPSLFTSLFFWRDASGLC